MKLISKLEELEVGRQYWARSKKDSTEFKPGIRMALYYETERGPALAVDLKGIEPDLMSTEWMLDNYEFLGPIPIPNLFDFYKYTIKAEASPEMQNLCQEIALPSGQTVTLRQPPEGWIEAGKKLLESAEAEYAKRLPTACPLEDFHKPNESDTNLCVELILPSDQICVLKEPEVVAPRERRTDLHPRYTTGLVHDDCVHGIDCTVVPIVPYFLSEEEQNESHIAEVLTDLLRLNVQMIAIPKEGKKTIVLIRPRAAQHKFHIHVFNAHQITSDMEVGAIVKNMSFGLHQPDSRAFTSSDAVQILVHSVYMRDHQNDRTS